MKQGVVSESRNKEEKRVSPDVCMPVGEQRLTPSCNLPALLEGGHNPAGQQYGPGNRGAGCRMRVSGSSMCGATELPRRKGSAQPGKVREGFLEEGDLLLSLRRGVRIQQQKEVKAH